MGSGRPAFRASRYAPSPDHPGAADFVFGEMETNFQHDRKMNDRLQRILTI